MERHPTRSAGISSITAVLLLAACGGGGEDGSSSPSAAAPCADLSFQGRWYDEWWAIDPSGLLQEVGDATYPECNGIRISGGADPDGFRATDVWLLEGAEVTDALIGLREGTHTYVVFLRVGADPPDL